MAYITKRGSSYSVRYTYQDEHGKSCDKWESFPTKEEAVKRQKQRDFPASVQEIVLSGCQSRCGLRPFYSREEKQLAQNAMRKMQIEPLAKRCYRELSGGQQQRVAIGRALITRPSLILADEPTGNLDSQNSSEVIALLKETSKKYEQTIIMITHNRSIAQTADRVLQVSDGTLTDFGRCRE